MSHPCTIHCSFWKLVPLLQLFGCGEIVLQTTDELESSSNPTMSDAGIVNDTFSISGSSLTDLCGTPVVLRGVNEMPTFKYDSKDGSSYFGEITQTNANAVRLYWQTSDSAEDLDRLLLNAEAKRLIPVIYAFNNANTNSTTTFSDAAAYWTSRDVLPIVLKHRQWLILALRERSAAGASAVETDWAANVDAAVKLMRQAGINVPLAVDAPQYGIDTVTLAQVASDRILADPRQNIIFSVNAWWPNISYDQIRSYIAAASNTGLPTMIGEFSGYAQGNPECLNVTFDYATVIQLSQDARTSWFAWSWGAAPNTPPCTTFNMTSDGKFAGLYGWGLDVAVTNPNSIRNTSVAPTFVPGAGCPK